MGIFLTRVYLIHSTRHFSTSGNSTPFFLLIFPCPSPPCDFIKSLLWKLIIHTNNLKFQNLTPEVFVENCEDLIGIDVTYEAYQKYLENQANDPYLQGLKYKPSQLFWIILGNNHCAYSETERNGVLLKYRLLNIIKNSRHFAQDFGCKTHQPMNPEKKCLII